MPAMSSSQYEKSNQYCFPVKNKIIIKQSVKKYYQVEDDTFCDKFSILVQILAKIITENLFLIYLKLKNKLTISSKLRSFPAPPPGGGHVLLASQSPYLITVYSVANYRPHLSHSDATPSSGSSPLASYRKVLSRAFPPFKTGSTQQKPNKRCFQKFQVCKR